MEVEYEDGGIPDEQEGEEQAVFSVLEALLESITLAEASKETFLPERTPDPKDITTEETPYASAEMEVLDSAGKKLNADEQSLSLDLLCSEILSDRASPFTDEAHTPDAEVLEMEVEEADTSATTCTISTSDQKVKEDIEPSPKVESDLPESVKQEVENEVEKATQSTPPGPSTPKAKPVPNRTIKSAPMLRRRRRKRLMTRQRQTSAGSAMKRNTSSPLGKRLVRKDGGHNGEDKPPPRKMVRKRKVGSTKQGKNAAQQEEDSERPILIPKRTTLSTAVQMFGGLIYRIGDIIQINGDDGELYYAQILRFLVDDYCEKFILIRWLVPREGEGMKHYHSTEFNPVYFAQGPCQDEPISMEDIAFVMRAPRNFGPGLLEPTLNKCGELSTVFNRNIPENTGTSIYHCKI